MIAIPAPRLLPASRFALTGYFAERMRATPDGDGNLLDHSLLFHDGGMGDGNLHQRTDVPRALLGKLGGSIKADQHIATPSGTPMTNLLVTALDKVGVPVASIGGSTGPLALDV